MAPQLDGFFQQVDASADHFIERLRKAATEEFNKYVEDSLERVEADRTKLLAMKPLR